MTPFITYFYDYTDSKFYENAANNLKQQIQNLGGELLVYNPQLSESYNINCLTSELYESKIDAIKDNFERVQKLISSDDWLFVKIKEM